MKSRIWFYSFIIFGSGLILAVSCKKDKPESLPELSTSALKKITPTSIISGGRISSDGGSYISARGMCWSTDIDPTVAGNITMDGTGPGYFISSITELTGGTHYYIRAYATNSLGTAYGNEMIVITPLVDVDGNIYNTTVIGNQIWMTSNLKTTRYNDNTAIPNVADNTAWSTITTPAYCWYKNDVVTNKDLYGALYNWFAVNTNKLCPVGWHVPTEKEWISLAENVGGEDIAGDKLKEIGLDHWREQNGGASNDFNFTALPGGSRTGLNSGSFHALGYYGWWWSGTETNLEGARARLMTCDESDVARGTGLKKNGYSVRCVKDY